MKMLIGRVVCTVPLFAPIKKWALSRWPNRARWIPLKLYSCVMAWWFKHEYLAEPDPIRREEIKAAVMGGPAGLRWARSYSRELIDLDKKFGALKYRQACPLLEEVDAYLAEARHEVLVIQIGCSSGTEIAWLRFRSPTHEFIGTDVYPEVSAFCRERYKYDAKHRLSFRTSSALDICDVIESESMGRPVIIISSGALEYVQPEHLSRLFHELSRLKDVRIMLQEPILISAEGARRISYSHWRGNFSFSHDYQRYAREAGLKVLECREIRPYVPPEKYPGYRNAANCYLVAESAPYAEA